MGRIIIVTLLWNEIMGSYNTPDTHNGRDRSVKVGHEISMCKQKSALCFSPSWIMLKVFVKQERSNIIRKPGCMYEFSLQRLI